MIRHFLGVFFWSFIGVVVFVNLFQYSGAVLPFYDVIEGGSMPTQNTIFGFSSIITFVQTIGDSEGINLGLNITSQGIRFLQMVSVDDIATFFQRASELQTQNASEVVLFILMQFFNILVSILLTPIMLLASLLFVVVGVLVFAWNLLQIFFNFILGTYNTPLVAVGNLPNAYMSAYAFY